MRTLSRKMALVSALLIIAASLLGGCISLSNQSGSKASSTAQQPAEINIYGNTPGNLANGGIVAQQGDWIYYTIISSVSSDTTKPNGQLCKIRTDGSGEVKLNSDVSFNINVVGDWIYYVNVQPGNIFKIRTDGTGKTKLNSNESRNIYVVGDWIYYQDDQSYLCKSRTDGTGETKLGETEGPSFFNVVGDWIYYIVPYVNNSDDSCIYKIRTDGTEETMILSDREDFLSINVVSDWIYYVIGSAHGYGNLYKIHTDGTGKTELSNDKIANINVVGDWIYYVIGSAPSDYAQSYGDLYKIHTDGTGKTKLSNKKIAKINVVGDWIYYINSPDGKTGDFTYKIRTDGTENQKVD
jgi:hypothetical protein